MSKMSLSVARGLLLSSLLGMAIGGCGPDDIDDESGPIVVGLAYGFGDEAAQIEGAQLAVSEINSIGGIKGRSVELVPIDTAGDPPVARDAVEEFVREHPDAQGIVGPIRGFSSLFAAPIAHREQIPMVTIGGAYIPSFRDVNPNDDRYAYSVRMSRVEEARYAGRAFRDTLGCSRALYIAGYVRGAEQEEVTAFRDEFVGDGRELIGWEVHLPEFSNFEGMLEPYLADPPDCMYFHVDELPAILFINAWVNLGGDPGTIPVYGWEPQVGLLERFISNPEYFDEMYAMGQELNETGPAGVRFRDRYEATFGEAPGEFSSARYDAMAVLLLGIAAAPVLEGSAVRDGMLRVSRDNTAHPSEDTFTAGELDRALDSISRGFDIQYQGASGNFELADDGSASSRVFRVWRMVDIAAGEYVPEARFGGPER